MTRQPTLKQQPRVLGLHSASLPQLQGKAALEPIHIKGIESLSELYRYDILLSTPDNPSISSSQAANIPIKQLIGKEASISIELDNHQQRHISGIVTQGHYIKSQDRRSIYQITLEPWLSLAKRNTHFKIFQHQNVLDIIQSILANYPYSVENHCAGWGITTASTPASSYPLLDYQVQYGESDYDYINRLMRQWGIYYYFKHSANGHSLILVDDTGSHQPNPGTAYQSIPYYPEGHKTQQEYIQHFQSQEQQTTGIMTGNHYDFRSPKAQLEQTSHMARNTGHADSHIQGWVGINLNGTPNPNSPQPSSEELAQETARLQHHTHIHLQSLGVQGVTSQGQGHLRGITTGCTFSLTNHPQQTANRDYLITSSQLEITNNPTASGEENYFINSHFNTIPADHSYRACIPLDSHGRIQKPRTSGPQSAHVTGPANQDLWTDPYGRIKISFPWNPYCPKDETSSCWVRIASPAGGGDQGHIQIPRIGQEVLVDFEHGDPDRPVVIGILNNPLNKPSWQLPGQAALGGMRSRELTASGQGNAPYGRSNHLIFDDSAGQIQAQLKSDHQHSQLSLGYITRVEDHQGRKDFRGEGFELRTDGHGALRAKDGVLISTEARGQAVHHVLSSQEAQARLKGAYGQHQAAGELAQGHQAYEARDHVPVDEALEGQYKALKGGGELQELAAPHVVVSSSAGIVSSAKESTHQHSGGHHVVTSGEHVSVSAGGSLLASVKGAIRLFAYRAGMKLVAASGKLVFEAQSGELVLLAKEDIKISSCKGELRFTSPKRIIFNGGGSFMQWDKGGIIQGTDGAYVEHASKIGMAGARGMGVDVKGMPHVDVYDEQFAPQFLDGTAISACPYVLKSGKDAHTGQTNLKGLSPSVNTKASEKVAFEIPFSELTVSPEDAS